MSEPQSLFAALVLIYFSECFFSLRPGEIALRAGLTGKSRILRPEEGFEFAGRRLLLVPPFPFFQGPFIVEGARAETARAFDLSSLRDELTRFHRTTRTLSFFCQLQFWVLFLLAPVAGLHFGFARSGLFLLLIVMLLDLVIGIAFFRSHLLLFPKARFDRLLHTAIVLIAPPAAVRASDQLRRNFLVGFHPMTVAAELAGRDELERFARESWLELSFGPDGAQNEGLESFLCAIGLPPGELSEAPLPSDPTCRSYCPRCRQQFTLEQGVCEACGGVPLLGFDA